MWTKSKMINVSEVPEGLDIHKLTEASSLDLMEIDAAKLPASERYTLYQHRKTSWSHNGDWGANAMNNAEIYLNLLQRARVHYEDDIFCDFGGNDGTIAESWRMGTGNQVISVDLDKLKQGWGHRSYPEVTFVNSILEDIPLEDKSVDWGFCSHTLEHVADLPKALNSLARIIRRGLFVVVPLEIESSFLNSDPHMRASQDPLDWLRHLRHPDMNLVNWSKEWKVSGEMCILYSLEDFGCKMVDSNWYWLDEMDKSATNGDGS